MPPLVRIVFYSIAVALSALALFMAWGISARGFPLSDVWLIGLCFVALVGFVRRLSWGRFLVSFISILSALFVSASLIPDPDDVAQGSMLEHWFGSLPPVWLSWVVVVTCAMLVLLPAVIVGWQKSWFRSAWW